MKRRTGTATILLGRPATPPRERRARALIILHADGYAEAYGVRGEVEVHFAQALDVAPENEVAAEAYLDATLPARFRELHVPVNLRACRMPQKVTVDNEIEGRFGLALLNEVKRTVWKS
jgi:hypothetical protein